METIEKKPTFIGINISALNPLVKRVAFTENTADDYNEIYRLVMDSRIVDVNSMEEVSMVQALFKAGLSTFEAKVNLINFLAKTIIQKDRRREFESPDDLNEKYVFPKNPIKTDDIEASLMSHLMHYASKYLGYRILWFRD